MGLSFFDTLPQALKDRHVAAAERQRAALHRKAVSDSCAPERAAALDEDWLSHARRAEARARHIVEDQSEAGIWADGRREMAAQPAAEAFDRVVSQARETKRVHQARRDLGLKHMPARPPFGQTMTPVHVKHATAEELAELVRARLERIGARVPQHLRPTSHSEEQALRGVTFLCRGNELMDKASFLEAVANYSVALRHAPADAFALLNRGCCHAALRSLSAAEADFRSALAGPQGLAGADVAQWRALVANNLGAVRQAAGDMVGAYEAYTQAILDDPACHMAWKNRAGLHRRHGGAPHSAQARENCPREFADSLAGLDQDWHLQQAFTVGGVHYDVEMRRGPDAFIGVVTVNLIWV